MTLFAPHSTNAEPSAWCSGPAWIRRGLSSSNRRPSIRSPSGLRRTGTSFAPTLPMFLLLLGISVLVRGGAHTVRVDPLVGGSDRRHVVRGGVPMGALVRRHARAPVGRSGGGDEVALDALRETPALALVLDQSKRLARAEDRVRRPVDPDPAV